MAFFIGVAEDNSSLQSMIDAIQAAPAHERYQKMNAFKEHLKALNNQQRAQAIEALQHKMPTHAPTPKNLPHTAPHAPQQPRQSATQHTPNNALQKSKP
ncbi:MAG: hypothetical protein KU37_00865 [Sulfuricurvum sp. PC08-66]|nr:MAG: hypothetical protein KU37_00865 [Sulfuricurvum sp. PC08-66]